MKRIDSLLEGSIGKRLIYAELIQLSGVRNVALLDNGIDFLFKQTSNLLRKLVLGDALLRRTISKQSIDLIVTSSPYNVRKRFTRAISKMILSNIQIICNSPSNG